jgi:tRNA A-37 threonylcarbamoyl transferase component Bud32
MTNPQAQSLRDGRYVVIGLLGEGAQGSTLEAVDKLAGRPVAIKRFQVRGAKSWKDVELAEREARVLSSLSHSALPAYVEHFEQDGCLYLVMEKIEGEKLSDIRQRGIPLSQADVVRFLSEVGEALDYLHSRAPPVIHRDIKPGNVIRRPDGSFALVDFGSVRDSLKPEGGSTVVGTFGYMAPEQFQSRAMPTSDVYAAGATALAMLTAREPEELPHRGLGIDVSAALAGQADPALVRALAAMVAIDPEQRASSIAPLLAAVDHPPAGRSEAASDRRSAGYGGWPHGARPAPTVGSIPPWQQPGARRHGRRAGRRGRHWAHRQARNGLPARDALSHPVVVFAVLLGLTVAQLAVFFGLRVIVPVLLTLLSIVLGSGLRRAARAADRAGQRAGDGLRQAYRLVREHSDRAAATHRAQQTRARAYRVDPDGGTAGPRPRVRVPRQPPAEQPLDGEPPSEPEANQTRARRR